MGTSPKGAAARMFRITSGVVSFAGSAATRTLESRTNPRMTAIGSTGGARIANADSRIRSVRDNLAGANGVAGATLADGLPLDFRGRITPIALQSEANTAPRFFQVHVTRAENDNLNTMGIQFCGAAVSRQRIGRARSSLPSFRRRSPSDSFRPGVDRFGIS